MANINTSTPPRSPYRSSSPSNPKPAEQPNTPLSCSISDPHENGYAGGGGGGGGMGGGEEGDSDKENTTLEVSSSADQLESEEVEEGRKDAIEQEPYPVDIEQDHHQQHPDSLLPEPPVEPEMKQRKNKKKKKRKASRHESEEEKEGKEGRKKKDRRHSHKSQEGKNSSVEKELVHEVHSALGSEGKGVAGEVEDAWSTTKLPQDTLRSRSRSRDRSRSRSREGEVSSRYDILTFDPRVPPPTTTFVPSATKDPFYQVPPFVSTGNYAYVMLHFHHIQ